MADGLRHSPLEARHRALGAKLTEFGGWQMPLDYGSVVAEHRAVRGDVGVFDLTHLGSLLVRGAEAVDAVQHAFSNDVATLGQGRAQYTLCLDDDAGIVDDLIVYRFADGVLAVPNAANTARVTELLGASAQHRAATVEDVTEQVVCLAVQGPRSGAALHDAGVDTSEMAFMDCRALGPGLPPQQAAVTRTGYTGERGYEVFLPAAQAERVWDALAASDVAPVGLGARDTLRLEVGYPLHGNDISPSTSPVEANLRWAVKPGTGFRGEPAYERTRAAGVPRRLRGLLATGRGIPRAGCEVHLDGDPVGVTTSGTFSPTLGVGVALGYLDTAVDRGALVDIVVRGKQVQAEVVRPPFVDANPKS